MIEDKKNYRAMENDELKDIVLRNTLQIEEMRHQLNNLISKEKRVEVALKDLHQRIEDCLIKFHRDQYKSTDQRLLICSIADEILIFEKLGYEIGVNGSYFLLGVAALLEGRNQIALDYFKEFIKKAQQSDKNLRNAYYLSAMVSYNSRDFNKAIEYFESAYRYSFKRGAFCQ